MSLLTSLESYWNLDEASGNAVDSHGSNTLAETSGTIAAATGPGGVSGSRDFEAGDTEYLTIADNASLSTGDIDFTIAAWVQFESLGANRSIVSKYNTGTVREYWLLYALSTDRLTFTVSNDGTATTPVPADSLGAPSTGTWYFVVAWHDAAANTTNIQVNDGAVDSVSYSSGVLDGGALFSFGATNSGAGTNHHDGLIAKVGFWKRVLTSGERTQLYNSGTGLLYSELTAAGGQGPIFGGRALGRGRIFGGSAFAA